MFVDRSSRLPRLHEPTECDEARPAALGGGAMGVRHRGARSPPADGGVPKALAPRCGGGWDAGGDAAEVRLPSAYAGVPGDGAPAARPLRSWPALEGRSLPPSAPLLLLRVKLALLGRESGRAAADSSGWLAAAGGVGGARTPAGGGMAGVGGDETAVRAPSFDFSRPRNNFVLSADGEKFGCGGGLLALTGDAAEFGCRSACATYGDQFELGPLRQPMLLCRGSMWWPTRQNRLASGCASGSARAVAVP